MKKSKHKKPKRTKLKKKKKRQIIRDHYQTHGPHCAYCQRPLLEFEELDELEDEICPHPDWPSVDHVIPVASGGSNHASNLVVSCFECQELYDDKEKPHPLRK